jgi:hypothetical protein
MEEDEPLEVLQQTYFQAEKVKAVDQFLTLYFVAATGSFIAFLIACAMDLRAPDRFEIFLAFVGICTPILNIWFVLHCMITISKHLIQRIQCWLATLKKSVRL